MFILLCSLHSFFLIELLTTSLILISFFFFLVALSLKSPTREVSINYCIVLYCIVNCFLHKAFNASLGKSKLIQVRNLSK